MPVFNAKDHNLYKSNFGFTNMGGSWMIDMIINPIPKTKLVLVNIGATQKGPPSGGAHH